MSTYTLAYLDEIAHDIARFPNNIKLRIRKAIEQRLTLDPYRYGEPLRRNLHGYMKMRVGDYRVIYAIQQSHVIIIAIGHRKDIYPKISLRLH